MAVTVKISVSEGNQAIVMLNSQQHAIVDGGADTTIELPSPATASIVISEYSATMDEDPS